MAKKRALLLLVFLHAVLIILLGVVILITSWELNPFFLKSDLNFLPRDFLTGLGLALCGFILLFRLYPKPRILLGLSFLLLTSGIIGILFQLRIFPQHYVFLAIDQIPINTGACFVLFGVTNILYSLNPKFNRILFNLGLVTASLGWTRVFALGVGIDRTMFPALFEGIAAVPAYCLMTAGLSSAALTLLDLWRSDQFKQIDFTVEVSIFILTWTIIFSEVVNAREYENQTLLLNQHTQDLKDLLSISLVDISHTFQSFATAWEHRDQVERVAWHEKVESIFEQTPFVKGVKWISERIELEWNSPSSQPKEEESRYQIGKLNFQPQDGSGFYETNAFQPKILSHPLTQSSSQDVIIMAPTRSKKRASSPTYVAGLIHFPELLASKTEYNPILSLIEATVWIDKKIVFSNHSGNLRRLKPSQLIQFDLLGQPFQIQTRLRPIHHINGHLNPTYFIWFGGIVLAIAVSIVARSRFRILTLMRVSEARKSLLSKVIASAPCGIIISDQTGGTLITNDYFEKLTGFSKAKLRQMPLHEIIPPAVATTSQSDLNQNDQEADFTLTKPDGSHIWVKYLFGRALNPEIPNQSLNVSILVDITERKQAEQMLATRALELERSNSELEQFAFVASHDLQEPLRKISSFMWLLMQKIDPTLDEEARHFSEVIVRCAERMQRLINDLLSYSRVRLKDWNMIVLDLNLCAFLAKSNLEFAIQENHAKLEIAPNLPKVMGDESSVVSLLQNLISNSLNIHLLKQVG